MGVLLAVVVLFAVKIHLIQKVIGLIPATSRFERVVRLLAIVLGLGFIAGVVLAIV